MRDIGRRLEQLIVSGKETLIEQISINNYDFREVEDLIFEIVDGVIPIPQSDQLALAVENIELAITEPELGAAFDGKNTVCNIIVSNVYEVVSRELEAFLEEMKEEYKSLEEDELKLHLKNEKEALNKRYIKLEKGN